MLMEAPQYSSWYQQQVYAGYMQQQIGAAQQNANTRLTVGNGYISPTTCLPQYLRPDGTCMNQGIMDTDSAYGIGGTLQNRDMMPYLRVAMAKDFDSIVTALVNQLIKLAVTDLSKSTGLPPQTIYSAGAGIINSAAQNNTVPRAIPVNPQQFNADGTPIPKASPAN